MPSTIDSLEYHQYLRAIEARDKLNENYHRWMTFYYVALGSILVTIVTLITADKSQDFTMIKLGLSVLATFISLVWHLSCKGYNYWSNSWMQIIKRLELRVINGKREFAVYTDFSKTVIADEKHSIYPTKSGNISTPKLTLIVSFCSIIIWAIFSCNEYYHYEKSTCLRLLAIILWFLTILIGYVAPLKMKFFESRNRDFNSNSIEEFQQN